MHNDKLLIEELRYMDTIMRTEKSQGMPWKYTNNTSKKAKSFEQARQKGKRWINCVDGVQWAVKLMGNIPTNALDWYGGNGKIVWCSSSAKANAKVYFEIVKTGGKLVKTLYKNGDLLPGDILLGYQGTSHTNCYLGDGKCFDSGASEGATFKKWVKNLTHKTYKVNYILRFRDHTQYRVQCGAFSDMGHLLDAERKLNNAGFKTERISEDGMIKLQAGLFTYPKYADALVAKIHAVNLPAFVKEI